MPRNLCLALIFGIAAVPAVAQAPRLVSNPDMCSVPADDVGQLEMGAVLTETSMAEIEYLCEFEPAIALDWSGERMQSRVGHCSEPGFVHPTVFTFVTSSYEPGQVTVWEIGSERPTVFISCR